MAWVDFRAVKEAVSMRDALARYGVQLRQRNGFTLRGGCPLPSHSSKTEDWFDEFYRAETTTDLFGDDHTRIVKQATTGTIGRYFVDRLKTVFTAVADQPRVLSNSKGSPLYLLCFAAGNPKGAPIALKIANHLLSPKTGWGFG